MRIHALLYSRGGHVSFVLREANLISLMIHEADPCVTLLALSNFSLPSRSSLLLDAHTPRGPASLLKAVILLNNFLS